MLQIQNNEGIRSRHKNGPDVVSICVYETQCSLGLRWLSIGNTTTKGPLLSKMLLLFKNSFRAEINTHTYTHTQI